MMRRREFITLLGGAAVAWPLSTRAQQPARYRIGHLAIAAPTDTPPPPPANWDAFVQGLREAGYVEGRNIAFEHRSAHDRPELFPKLALELASLKVDVIFARGTWALAAARNATRTIPIVGIDLDINPAQLRELERVAQSLSMQTRVAEVKNATDLDGAFDTAQNWRADALIVLSNPLNLAYRAQIAALAAKADLPTIYLYRAHVGAGGLISYGPDLPDMFRRCGVYVGKILGGTKPADLPLERPVRFELVVNLKTAQALGITIPETILVRADEVIE